MNEVQKFSTRDKIQIIENMMKDLNPTNSNYCHIDPEIKNYFVNGVYLREMYMPKGTMLVGMIHKYKNISIISKGDVSILIENEMKRFVAPCTFIAPKGAQRLAYAHEDTIWSMPMATNETDVEKIKDYFVAKTEEEFVAFCREQEQFKLFDTKVLT